MRNQYPTLGFDVRDSNGRRRVEIHSGEHVESFDLPLTGRTVNPDQMDNAITNALRRIQKSIDESA